LGRGERQVASFIYIHIMYIYIIYTHSYTLNVHSTPPAQKTDPGKCVYISNISIGKKFFEMFRKSVEPYKALHRERVNYTRLMPNNPTLRTSSLSLHSIDGRLYDDDDNYPGEYTERTLTPSIHLIPGFGSFLLLMERERGGRRELDSHAAEFRSIRLKSVWACRRVLEGLAADKMYLFNTTMIFL